jgi:hypothetical protein
MATFPFCSRLVPGLQVGEEWQTKVVPSVPVFILPFRATEEMSHPYDRANWERGTIGTASRITKLRWNGIWELRWNRNSRSCSNLRADASASLTLEFYAMTDTWICKGDPSAIMPLLSNTLFGAPRLAARIMGEPQFLGGDH